MRPRIYCCPDTWSRCDQRTPLPLGCAGSIRTHTCVPRFTSSGTTPGGLVLWKARGRKHDVLLTRFDVAFEHGLTLVGAGLPPEFKPWGAVISVEPGTTLPIWMAWAAEHPLEQRITFSLHLVDGSGKLATQIDQGMGQCRFPITLWHGWLQSPVVAGGRV